MEHFLISNQGINTYLEYELDETQEIDTLCMGMVKNNKIEGMLPVVFQQIDKRRYFKYTITSKITLNKFLEREVSRHKLLRIMESILKALMEGEEYMIPPSVCLLEENKIYVDSHTGEAFLICLPILDGVKAADIRLFFKNLLFQAKYESGEDNSYVAHLIGILNQEEKFCVSLFLREVRFLLGERGKGDTKETFNKPRERKVSLGKQHEEKKVQPLEKKPQESIGEIGQNLLQPERKGEIEKTKQGDMVWEFELNSETHKEEKNKKRGFFGSLFQKKSRERSFDSFIDSGEEPVFEFLMPGQEEPIHAKLEPSEIDIAPIVKSFVEDTPIPADFGGTTLLNEYKYDETSLLQEWGTERHSEPYLIRNQTQEKFYINKSVVRIGREKQQVDYCVQENKAVGRSHADIITRGQRYYVMDLNSKNRTFINGQAIPSQQEMEIMDGDCVRLANEEFIFHT